MKGRRVEETGIREGWAGVDALHENGGMARVGGNVRQVRMGCCFPAGAVTAVFWWVLP